MSTPDFTVLDVHENRDVIFPQERFRYPLCSEQFAELAALLKPALTFGADKPAAWQAGHQQGLLLALTLLERSWESGDRDRCAHEHNH